ncbi:MAG TPA: ABC transporter ATP-binding protein [Acidimicrobiia bacterium]|nr:ABC transporter ATP-binding protein [Acidimicrobiia bacterium]
MSDPRPPIVMLDAVTQRFGDVVALDDITLSVDPGVTGLVGANGAGKTTMLRALLGLVHPTDGRITVMGHDAATDPIAVRTVVGYMPEGSCLPRDQTAADFVAYTAELAGVPSKDARRRASETLYLVGLEEERFRFLGDFSTGMQQRVKLAQSIVHGPRLVLLDEPASGLDPAGREQMLALIRRLGAFGINVIVSSHVLSDIEETCQSVIMLDAGRLIRSGPLDDRTRTSTITVEVLDDPTAFVSSLQESGLAATADGLTISVEGTLDESAFDAIRDAAAATGTGILRLGRATVTLEQEFLQQAGAGS